MVTIMDKRQRGVYRDQNGNLHYVFRNVVPPVVEDAVDEVIVEIRLPEPTESSIINRVLKLWRRIVQWLRHWI